MNLRETQPHPYGNGRLYDLLAESNPSEQAFYVRRSMSLPGTVLELGSGTGRLSIPISEAGKRVVGLDSSEAMLQHARKKAGPHNVHFRVCNSDMTSFCIGETFGLIFAGLNTILHLTTLDALERSLACIRAHMRPSSEFVLDVAIPDAALLSSLDGTRVRVAESKDDETGLLVAVDEISTYDDITQLNTRMFYVMREHCEEEMLSVTLRFYFPEELVGVLSRNGFRITERFGDYDERRLCLGDDHQIVVCKLA